MGGKFCLSDDSHGVEQVGLNYHQCIPYLRRNGIARLYFLERDTGKAFQPRDSRFPGTTFGSLTLAELSELPFWTNQE
jgi:histidinol-phosphatase (PHP family)